MMLIKVYYERFIEAEDDWSEEDIQTAVDETLYDLSEDFDFYDKFKWEKVVK